MILPMVEPALDTLEMMTKPKPSFSNRDTVTSYGYPSRYPSIIINIIFYERSLSLSVCRTKCAEKAHNCEFSFRLKG